MACLIGCNLLPQTADSPVEDCDVTSQSRLEPLNLQLIQFQVVYPKKQISCSVKVCENLIPQGQAGLTTHNQDFGTSVLDAVGKRLSGK